jgi:hypothetical protein
MKAGFEQHDRIVPALPPAINFCIRAILCAGSV